MGGYFINWGVDHEAKFAGVGRDVHVLVGLFDRRTGRRTRSCPHRQAHLLRKGWGSGRTDQDGAAVDLAHHPEDLRGHASDPVQDPSGRLHVQGWRAPGFRRGRPPAHHQLGEDGLRLR